MKVIIPLILILFVSCQFTENKKVTNFTNDDWYKLENIQMLSEETVNKIDSSATVKVLPFDDRDSIKIVLNEIGAVNDSKEFAELLRDYVIATVFTQNGKDVPRGVEVELNFSRGLKYSFNRCYFELFENNFKDSSFVEYMEVLLTNVKAEDAVYFELTLPIIKEFYKEYEYDGSLLNLLLQLYFF